MISKPGVLWDASAQSPPHMLPVLRSHSRTSTMPPPRPSHSAEAARAAALQAEFNEKKWVWVPDDREGYLAGWVIREEGDMGEVVLASGGEVLPPLFRISIPSELQFVIYSVDHFHCTLFLK